MSKRAAELHSADEVGLSSDSGISRHGWVTPSAERISAARFLAGVLNAISPTFNHTQKFGMAEKAMDEAENAVYDAHRETSPVGADARIL